MPENQPQGENAVDATSILRGKKINPITGTQTSDDDPKGVWADNVYNNIQMEHAAHLLPQTTPGAAEVLADTIKKSAGNDGNVTPTEPKPENEFGAQDDSIKVTISDGEEVNADKKITQGETGPESRPDLQDLSGGASGSNAGII
jgi:hypothetical protein